jgi:hypothetical protein
MAPAAIMQDDCASQASTRRARDDGCHYSLQLLQRVWPKDGGGDAADEKLDLFFQAYVGPRHTRSSSE